MKKRMLGVVMGMMGLLSIAPVNATAAYVFHEDFAAPPLTAGTEANSFTDGWNNGDHGWEISGEGVPNTTDNTLGQRAGALFTGGDTTFANIRSYSTGTDVYALQSLPAGQTVTSGNVTLSLQNMLATLGGWGGSREQIWIMGKLANGDVAYAGIIDFGGIVGEDKIYAYETWGMKTIADTGTKTTDNKDLMWNGAFSPTAGNYATLSINFNLSSIAATVSTTDANGATSSILPVSFTPYSPVVEFTKVYLILKPSSTTNSLVYMNDFSITAVPEPATMCILGLGGLMALLRRAEAKHRS